MAAPLRNFTQFFKPGSPVASQRRIEHLLDSIKKSSGRPFNQESDLDQLVEEINEIFEVSNNRTFAHFNRQNSVSNERVGITFKRNDYLFNTKTQLYMYATNIGLGTTVEVRAKNSSNGKSENKVVTQINSLYNNAEIVTYTQGHI